MGPLAHEELITLFLKNPSVLSEYRRQLTPKMFDDDAPIMKAMLEIDTQGEWEWRDVVQSVGEDHKSRVRSLMQGFASVRRVEPLIAAMKQNHLDRGLKFIAKTLADDKVPAEERLNALQAHFDQLQNAHYEKGAADHEQRVEAWYEHLKSIQGKPQLAMGMLTEWRQFDALTNGIRRKDLIIIGGYTSHGKTAFETELALRLTKRGHRGAVFSLEMSNEQFITRMASNLAQIDQDNFRTGTLTDYQMGVIKEKMDAIKSIYIDDNRGVDAEYIANEVRRLKRERNIEYVMVDYVQDVAEKAEANDNTGSAIGRICRKLRKMAQKYDVAVILLSQVRRETMQGGYKLPSPFDLAGSTGIETSADMIIMIGREEQYDPDTERKNIMDVNIAKNRNGRCGKFELRAQMARNMIYNP
ncbi:replicative DNA helicase [Paenibacillus silvisoli]|uniref:replicative DNA helicase n=1 Tax=Paenibacillus silvisoli TaxID=3110539 RepID=UPI002806246C|nr:DnaB-like helicase C-terminal domain-containing protein [Paenibacillus silvisoli]